MIETFNAAHSHPINILPAIIAWKYDCLECNEVIIIYQNFHNFMTTEKRLRWICPNCHSQKDMAIKVADSYIFRGTKGAREQARADEKKGI